MLNVKIDLQPLMHNPVQTNFLKLKDHRVPDLKLEEIRRTAKGLNF